jgi:hypothetical protein
MIRRSLGGADDDLQTPTHRYADTLPLAGPFQRNPPGAAGWLFFLRRGGSTRMDPDMGALPPVRLGPP